MDHHLYLLTFCGTTFFYSHPSDDDAIDRLNRKYTVYGLISIAIISLTSLMTNRMSSLISCWNRANFPEAYINYSNLFCFIMSTYRLDTDEAIPNSHEDRKSRVLNYYQWTPFIILLMALFFYLPRLLWRALSVRSGIDLLDLIEAAGETKTLRDFENRNHQLKYIIDTIDMYVDDERRHANAEKRQTSFFKRAFQLICCVTGKFLGNYFITLYIFIKLYYIANVILQIWLLSLFLGTNFLQFGYESVKLFRHGLNQPESKYFPRETFCDFHVREPLRSGEPLQRITVQCVLTVNLFNQQIFTLLWIWYVFVLICNVYALIIWTIRLGSYHLQYKYIRSRLERTSRAPIPRFRFDFKYVKPRLGDYVHRSLVEAFLRNYLEADGYFFIRLLAANVSDFTVQEVIEQLWAVYVRKYGEVDSKRAEESFLLIRQNSSGGYHSYHWNPSNASSTADLTDGKKYSKSKHIYQHADGSIRTSGTNCLHRTTDCDTCQPV